MKCLSSIICIFIFHHLAAQQVVLDSIWMVLENEKVERPQLDILFEQAFPSVSSIPEDALQFGLKTQRLAIAKEDVAMEEYSYQIIGRSYFHLAQPDSAAFFAQQSIELGDILNSPKHQIKAYILLSDGAFVQEKTEQGLDALKAALAIAETNQLKKEKAAVLLALGRSTLYYNQADRERAKNYFEEARTIYQALSDDNGLASTYRSLGKVATSTAETIRFYQKALELFQKNGNDVKAAWTLFSMGIHAEKMEDPAQAIHYYQSSLAIFEKNQMKGGMADVLLNLGFLYHRKQENDTAIFYFEKSLQLAQDIPLKPNIRDAYLGLSDVYFQQNNYAKAYEYLKKNTAYKDSLYFDKLTAQIAESNARYETEQKKKLLIEQELEIVRQRSLRNQIIGGAMLFLLGVMLFFQWHFSRQKRKRTEAEVALKKEKVVAEQLREMDELKSRFFTNISHELRTPLTLIMAPLEKALSQIKEPSNRNSLKLAFNNSKKLQERVDEILELSKLEAGQLELRESTVSLQDTLRKIFYAFESLAATQQIQLHFHYDLEEEYLVELDVNKFEKIINNLMANALRFTPTDGTISLIAKKEFSKKQTWLSIQIKDTGSGIAASDVPHIFDRFYQAQQSVAGGTGIGLALAKELAQRLGGSLHVQSQLGIGSNFTLRIPMKRVTSPTLTVKENIAIINTQEDINITTNPSTKTANILIVEDNPEMARFLYQILSEHHQCQMVTNGNQALKALENNDVDLIISDVMMPEMDGFSLRKKMNQRAEWKPIPFIFLTARTLEADKIKGLQLGVDDYITKPFSVVEVVARVENLLKNKAAREAWRPDVEITEDIPLSVEEQLVKDAEQLVRDHIHDPLFKVADLAQALNYSTRQLSRLLKKQTGLSSVHFILEIRLQHAYQLLQQRRFLTVAEVRYEVGIESASYFTKQFKARFGRNPSALLEG